MTELRYRIILRKHYKKPNKTIVRNFKTDQTLMLDPIELKKIFDKGIVFRMACIGFKNVKIISMTTGIKEHGEHELTVLEVDT